MHWTCDPDFVGPYPPLADGRANGCYCHFDRMHRPETLVRLGLLGIPAGAVDLIRQRELVPRCQLVWAVLAHHQSLCVCLRITGLR